MANVKISGIAAETTSENTMLVEVENASGVSKSMTRANFLGGGSDGSEDTISGSKNFTGKVGVGNNIDFSGTLGVAFIAANLYDDFAGTNSGVQAASVMSLTGTPANITGKLVANNSGIIATSIDAGTAPHTYWGAYEAGVVYNPGSAYTLPALRTFESDPTFHSGTVSSFSGFNTRFHLGSPGTYTLSEMVGFHSHGPKGSHSSATLGDMIGFLQRFDQDSALSATFANIYGVLIDNPSKKHASATLAYTNAYGICLNGYGAGSDIVFGDSKEYKLTTTYSGITGDAVQLAVERHKESPTANYQAFSAKLYPSGAFGTKEYSAFTGICQTEAGSASGTGACAMLGGEGVSYHNPAGAYTMPTAIGLRGYVIPGGTITNGIAINAKAAVAGGGVLTNATGIKVDKQTIGATINEGIWMAGDDIGADISFGADRDVKLHFNGTNLELEGSGISHSGVTTETLSGYITIAVNGVAYKLGVVS